MNLVDTSAWPAHLRGDRRAEPLRAVVADSSAIACTGPVLLEVLGGARFSAELERLRRMLLHGGWIPVDPSADFEAAARVYAASRSLGIIPRGFVDCMIAAIAVRAGVELLTLDRGFRDLQRVAALRLHDLSA